MKKFVNKFILWYLLRYCNACLRYNGKVIRVFSQGFYDDEVREYLNEVARVRMKGGE